MVVDFAIDFLLVRPGRPRYPMFVHQATALLHASFRPRLATTPLRFANPSPPSGWIRDLHPKTVKHARHTMKTPPWQSQDGDPKILFLVRRSVEDRADRCVAGKGDGAGGGRKQIRFLAVHARNAVSGRPPAE